MKIKSVLSFVCFSFVVLLNAQTVGLSDLMTPDDVMLRKPAKKAATKEVAPVAKPEEKPAAKPEEKLVAKLAEKVEEVKPASAKPLTAENTNQPDVTQMAVPEIAAAEKKEEKPKQKKLTGREAVITAERTDYDRKEGVILFDRNVYVDDEQYQMHSDRLFVFLDGTNQLKRLVAIGNVSITNENKTAWCVRATYNKSLSRIVMYGDDTRKARLREDNNKGGNTVLGDKITFWLDSEQVEIEGPAVTLPGGALGGKEGAKGIFNQMK